MCCFTYLRRTRYDIFSRPEKRTCNKWFKSPRIIKLSKSFLSQFISSDYNMTPRALCHWATLVLYISYSLSTNRKNPLLFFWSIDNALTAISCNGGSPFCPLSRSTSNSMCEYANRPKKRRIFFYLTLLSGFVPKTFYLYIYIYQQPIFWAPGQPRTVTRHRFCHNSCLFLNRFQKVPFQKY